MTPHPLSRISASRTAEWCDRLPILTGRLVTLRELRLADATSLLAMTTHEVAKFMSTPPSTVQGFETFIASAHLERTRGTVACFAIVPHGMETAVGLFQIRQLEPSFATAEWGFALGTAFWGTGMFLDGAALAIDFAFDTIGVTRLEARAAVANGRANAAMRKLGAVAEASLRQSFLYQGQYVDQILWSIVGSEWREAKTVWSSRAQVH